MLKLGLNQELGQEQSYGLLCSRGLASSPPWSCCVLGAQPATGSIKSTRVKILKESHLETLSSQKTLPQSQGESSSSWWGERIHHPQLSAWHSADELWCCVLVWTGGLLSWWCGGTGQCFAGKQAFGGSHFWIEKHFALQSIRAPVSQVLPWLMHLGSGEKAWSRAALNLAVIPRWSRVHAGKDSSSCLPSDLVSQTSASPVETGREGS